MTNSTKRPTAEVITPAIGEIDKVRDILFGKYVAEFEVRFKELEERLEQDVAKLTDKLSEKIEAIDGTISESLQRLDEVIAKEKRLREVQMNEINDGLLEAQNSIVHHVATLEDQAQQEIKQVKESLEESYESLMEQAQVARVELDQQMQMSREQLEKDKVSRESLALMLDEVAVKLRSS